MVASNDRLAYVQVGYMQPNYNDGDTQPFATYHFNERSTPGGFVRDLMGWRGSLLNGETHRYFVQYSPGKQAFEMNIDVTNTGDTPFNPFVAWPVRPWDLQWLGESPRRVSTDVPGNNANRTRFTDMQVQPTSDFFVPNIPVPLVPHLDEARWRLTPALNREFFISRA